ncbi:hypothetical protein BJX66DRAFT_213711 [Aspergillus keveii]|uniref:Uncharacterized protein n=1 Tax=Aspergillus keveii TaxID=714993 RepID=A0ABR4GMC5_9EURO
MDPSSLTRDSIGRDRRELSVVGWHERQLTNGFQSAFVAPSQPALFNCLPCIPGQGGCERRASLGAI